MDLLVLPAEVRRRIFEVYFEGRRLWWKAGSSRRGRTSSDSVSLLFSCKQVYDESRSLMLATAQVDITTMIDFGYSVLYPAVFDMFLLKDVYLSVAGPIKTWKAMSYTHLLRRLSGLRSFTFCYDDSVYSYDTAFLEDGMSKADLDFIEKHPERILGDEHGMSSASGPLQNIELHTVEPFTDRMVTVWKQEQRSFRLIAEFTVTYEGVDESSGTDDLIDITYGVRILSA